MTILSSQHKLTLILWIISFLMLYFYTMCFLNWILWLGFGFYNLMWCDQRLLFQWVSSCNICLACLNVFFPLHIWVYKWRLLLFLSNQQASFIVANLFSNTVLVTNIRTATSVINHQQSTGNYISIYHLEKLLRYSVLIYLIHSSRKNKP